jgi:hypothetical protein
MRLSVFSRTDPLVPWEHVWRHGEQYLKVGGAPVVREVFDDTGHVVHARADPGRSLADMGGSCMSLLPSVV